jgi:hypothetical protein
VIQPPPNNTGKHAIRPTPLRILPPSATPARAAAAALTGPVTWWRSSIRKFCTAAINQLWNFYALEHGAIWPYVKAHGVYRCPADQRNVNGIPVVRSYSMNAWMNGKSFGDPTGSSNFTTPEKDASLTYILFRTESQVTQPATLWNLIGEDETTINDSFFMVDMNAHNGIWDLPSSRHGDAYKLNFADGHAETIRFPSPRISV